MSRILLLGGTGAMGVYLRDILSQNNYTVYVTTRSCRRDYDNVHYLQGNAHDIGFISPILKEITPDAIVDFMSYTTDEFSKRHVQMLAGTGHYVFLSSYRVFNEDKVITEKSPRLLDTLADRDYLRTDEYALRKARSEDMLRGSARSNWTIIRPGITYSKQRFQLGCLEANTLCYRSFHALPVVMPSLMRGKETTLTWGRDVALMISKLLLNIEAMGEDFNCVTAEHHKWDDVCDIYHREIGADIRDCSVEDYISIVGSRAQVEYDRLFDRIMDNSKVLRVTGIKQSELTKLNDGLASELGKLKSNPSCVFPDVTCCARIDKLFGTRTPLNGMSLGMRLTYWEARNSVIGHGMRFLRRLRSVVG